MSELTREQIAERVREACANAARSCGRPAGASDGATCVVGTSFDAEKAIRALDLTKIAAPQDEAARAVAGKGEK